MKEHSQRAPQFRSKIKGEITRVIRPQLWEAVVPDAEGSGSVTLMNTKWSRNKCVSLFTVFINTHELCIWWVSFWYLYTPANVCCLWPATCFHPVQFTKTGEIPVLGLGVGAEVANQKKQWLDLYWVSIPSNQFRAYEIDPISRYSKLFTG